MANYSFSNSYRCIIRIRVFRDSYIVAVSFISGKNAAYGFGAIFTPYIITIINSLFRNKFKFKKTFDDKFYPFFMGLLGFAFISTTLSAIF